MHGIWRRSLNNVRASPRLLQRLFSAGGDRSSVNPLLPGLSTSQIKKIAEMDHMLRERHLQIEGVLSSTERDEARRRRMIYRSKQRGWLEVDLLLGSWAVEHIPELTEVELDEYEIVLKEETIDIYNFISGKDPLPPHLQELNIMKKLKEYAFERNMTTPEGYEATKRRANLT